MRNAKRRLKIKFFKFFEQINDDDEAFVDNKKTILVDLSKNKVLLH